MATRLKDPADVLDYALDLTDWLVDADTISSHVVTVSDGITLDSDSHTDTRVTAWLSGGTAGVTYTLTFRATTAQGRTVERSDRIQVVER